MHITFVKKTLANGSPCQKCKDVEQRLNDTGQMSKIDEVIIADERDPDSAGMLLAAEVKAERAPFFVVDTDEGERKVYTVYFKFAKEVLGKSQSKKDEAKEILNDNPDLDFI
jgi:hypothetical protein